MITPIDIYLVQSEFINGSPSDLAILDRKLIISKFDVELFVLIDITEKINPTLWSDMNGIIEMYIRNNICPYSTDLEVLE